MATFGVFELAVNDGRQDRLIMEPMRNAGFQINGKTWIPSRTQIEVARRYKQYLRNDRRHEYAEQYALKIEKKRK